MTTAAPSTLADKIEEIRAQLAMAITAASKALEGNPDNPNITRFPGSVKAFSVSFAQMAKSDGGRIDPFFHDWLAQYEQVQKLLEARSFSAIADLIETGKVEQRKGVPPHRYAPEVVARVREIFGEPEALRGWAQMVWNRKAGDGPPVTPDVTSNGIMIDRAEPRQLARRRP